MSSQTVVATANVLRSLGRADARAALQGVLELKPDLVGLQEWEVFRLPLLRETGSVTLAPFRKPRWRASRVRRTDAYAWCAAPVGGCAVGARADRYELLRCTSRLLSRPGRAERADRPFGMEPPRLATVAEYLDLLRRKRVTLISYHLAAGVQRAGAYRTDRPRLCARHTGEIGSLQRIVDRYLAAGHDVYAVGDSNFHGMRLNRLTSIWEGRDDHAGTHGGGRKIDDVHGPSAATEVRLLVNKSDHRAVVATRLDD